jgi:hypothetical protein
MSIALVRPHDRQPAQQIRVDLVARLRLGRARRAIERLYPHPPHQRRHVTAADLAQQAAQDPRAGEGELQMQPVKTPHDFQVGRRHRAWQVVDAATADAQNVCLLGDRQIVLTVDHRFALSDPALVSAPSKKSFSQRQFADLSVQRLHVDGRRRRFVAAAGTENISSPALELRFRRACPFSADPVPTRSRAAP